MMCFILKVLIGSARYCPHVDLCQRHLLSLITTHQTKRRARFYLSADLEISSLFYATESSSLVWLNLYLLLVVFHCGVIGGQWVSRWKQHASKMLSPSRTVTSRLLRPASWVPLRLGPERRAASTLQKGNSVPKRFDLIIWPRVASKKEANPQVTQFSTVTNYTDETFHHVT